MVLKRWTTPSDLITKKQILLLEFVDMFVICHHTDFTKHCGQVGGIPASFLECLSSNLDPETDY
jgi:hypothetical protein